MKAETLTGSCLCGRVAFRVALPLLRFVHCHCSRCRKSSGAAHSTNIAVRSHQLTWLAGSTEVHEYELPSAKRFGRCFCAACGCPMPRTLPGTDIVVVPAGSLDGEIGRRPSDHLYWDSRAVWGCPADGIPVHSEAAPL